MKAFTFKPTSASVGAVALALAALTSLPAQTPAPPAPGGWGPPPYGIGPGRGPMMLQLATPELEAWRLSQFATKPLRGSGQEELGNITDFLLDAQSGRVRFAIVPSGAGPAGQTYRLIPMMALDAAPAGDGLTLKLAKAQWDQVGTMTEAELQNRITLSTDQQQRLIQQFALGSQADGWGSGQVSGELVRASQLNNQPVRAGADQLGTVEDVVVDLRRKVAAVLLKPAAGIASGEQKFLVPFQQVQLGANAQAGLTTNLSRTDFQQAASSPTPTGAASGGFVPGGMPGPAAAHAVRQALDRDPSVAVARASVQVAPEAKISLRGNVDSEQVRSNIERIAKEAAGGLEVENHITVQGR